MNKVDEKVARKYEDKWLKIVEDTTPMDEAKFAADVEALYKAANFGTGYRNMFKVDNPVAGAYLAQLLLKYPDQSQVPDALEMAQRVIDSGILDLVLEYDKNSADIKSIAQGLGITMDKNEVSVGSSFAGTLEFYWVGGHEMAQKELGESMQAGFDELVEICKNVGWMWTFNEAVIYCDKPRLFSYDKSTMMIDSTKDACLAYGDLEFYAIKGEVYDHKSKWAKESAKYETEIGKLIYSSAFKEIEDRSKS